MSEARPKVVQTLQVITHSPEETRTLGKALASLLYGGEVIGLEGELGSGKTTLIQGIARGLGVEGPVTSPTFTLAATYIGNELPLYHLDLYRIDKPQEFTWAGLEELIWGKGVAVVEWAEKGSELLPEENLWIKIDFGDGEERQIQILAQGAKYEAILQELAKLSTRCAGGKGG
ncbi:MAG: tRNA (adenosine(37)-N6)-threonylcarbamoyltransferase complex ATPase subunit type 1 TsaE [Chloroflexi bacterium]|nr:tRNA (adenosine(37)-N6)-threonylcarbamoyltransferase complex ATPase subunit type 1 TsaE [Chloroflexota bacterium]